MRQWPCGANARSRLPFGPQPLIGDMLVLIQVSSMKTSRFGIEMILQGLPSLSSVSNVGTRLLKGEQRFF